MSLGEKRSELKCEDCNKLDIILIDKSATLNTFFEQHNITSDSTTINDISICAFSEGFIESCRSFIDLSTNNITAFSLQKVKKIEPPSNKYCYQCQIINIGGNGKVIGGIKQINIKPEDNHETAN